MLLVSRCCWGARRTILPHQEFERLIPRQLEVSEISDHENPGLYMLVDLYNSRTINLFMLLYSSSPWLVLDDYQRESFSRSTALAFWSVRAPKSAVEALEKFRYERSNEDENEDESKLIKCVICMEEVMVGFPSFECLFPIFFILIAFCGC